MGSLAPALPRPSATDRKVQRMRQITALRLTLLVLALTLAIFASPAAAQQTTLDVELGDFYIDMPTSVTAGSITFNVSNVGAMQHTITIEGQGVNTSAPIVAPGSNGTLTVDLAPGTYTIWCPVGQHRQAGMETTLTVTAASTDAAPSATALPAVPQTGHGGAHTDGANTTTLLLLALVVSSVGIAGALAYRHTRA